MDAVKAFIQFLVDLFSALSVFLTGGELADFDIGNLFGELTDKTTDTNG